MKKVAIMTWYQHKNYGTTLQATALIHVIREMGYNPYGIDYISKGYDRETRLEKFLSIKKIKEGFKNSYKAKKYPSQEDAKKWKRYNAFLKKYIPMETSTQTASQLFLLNEKYDAFVCGSDQIWTPFAYNSKYFLDFVLDPRKKISYAPSFGVNEIRNQYVKEEIGKQLKSFSALSVREKQGSDMIKEYYGLQAKVVIDPTLLLNANDWDTMCGTEEKKDRALLCYVLGENEKVWKNIRQIAKKNNLEVYVIPVHSKDYDRGFRVLEGIGPSEFLSEFKNADYVCTDSFHGTVFSIIYHKPFIAFKRFADNDPKSQNSRVLNLLNSLKLEQHLWNGIPRFTVTNWELVDEILGELRKKSLEYLKNALTRATQSRNEKNKHKVITNTCCGCGVCAKSCPKRAIKMKMVNGFYQAVVNDVLCINCGLCNHICAFNGEIGIQLNDASLFEAKSKDKKILQASTSGGIAQEIILKLLKKNYPVWGCVFDTEDGRVKHTLLSHFDETAAARFQGSKYLQSCFFEDDVSILDKSQGVIIGTPCQIAATDNYLRSKKKRNQFILVDLICHGVPTKNLWKVYLKDEGMKEEDVTEVHFRDSNKGWREIYIYIKSTQKEIHRKETKDLFYKFFDLQACYMPSCYECNYRTTSKADIRLGDYWGKKYTPNDLRYGVSMVVAFSEHGRAILRELKSDGRIELAERPIQDYFSGQGPVNPIVPLYYSKLMADLENNKESLRSLLYKHCYIKYLNKRIQLRVAKIRKIVLKR